MTTITMNPKTNVYAIYLTTGGTETVVADEMNVTHEGIVFLNRVNSRFEIVSFFKNAEYRSFKQIRANIER